MTKPATAGTVPAQALREDDRGVPMIGVDEVVRAALRVQLARLDEDHAHADAEQEYADEQLCLAARNLVNAVNALPPYRLPVGWNEE